MPRIVSEIEMFPIHIHGIRTPGKNFIGDSGCEFQIQTLDLWWPEKDVQLNENI